MGHSLHLAVIVTLPHRCVLCHYNKHLMNALFAQLALYKITPKTRSIVTFVQFKG